VYFFAYSQKYPALQQEARLLLMVGVLGGFTTFSRFWFWKLGNYSDMDSRVWRLVMRFPVWFWE